MTSLAPQMKLALEKVISSPRQRSSRWISTSIPEQRWSSSIAKYASPEYFVNNLCSDVHFKTALKHVPTNAIVIEIGPLSVMQAILKKALSPLTVQIPLMGQLHDNQLIQFWSQLGYMYINGLNLNPMNLFVPINKNMSIYPVPVGTRFLSTIYQRLMILIKEKVEFRMPLIKNFNESIYEQQLTYLRTLWRFDNVTVEQKKMIEELEFLVKQTQHIQSASLLDELHTAIYKLEGLYTLKCKF